MESQSATSRDAGTLPLVRILVVTYDGRHHLSTCFGSLRTTEYANYRVTLLDNGSRDDSSEYTAREFPWVEIIRVDQNHGYATGANVALERIVNDAGDYVVLLNDDIRIVDPGWLAQAVAAMERHASIGMLGFTILATDTDGAGAAGRGSRAPELRPCEQMAGCAMLVRQRLLRAIGTFDAGFFVYGDDDDLQMRVRQAGSSLASLDVPIVHYGEGTTKKNAPFYAQAQFRSSIRFSIKHRGVLRTLLRILKMSEIALNPWSFCFDPRDASHRRMRGEGHVFRNARSLGSAIGWNLARYRETVAAGREHRRLARSARLVVPEAPEATAGSRPTAAAAGPRDP